MLKHSFLISFVLLFMASSYGQNFKISKVKKLITAGNLNPESGYLFYENKKSGENFKFYTLGFVKNSSKNPSPNISFSVESGNFYISSTQGKDRVFIWFFSAENFINKVFIVQSSSKKAESVEFSSGKNTPVRYGYSNGNHIILYQSWKDRERLILTGYDSSFNKRWEFFELEGSQVVGVFITNERAFAVTVTESGGYSKQSFSEINFSTGKPISRYSLPAGNELRHIILNDVFVHTSSNAVLGLFTGYMDEDKGVKYVLFNFSSQKKIEFLPLTGELLPFMYSHGIINSDKGYFLVGEHFQITTSPKSKIIHNRFKEMQYRELTARQKEINLIERKIQTLQREKEAGTAPENSDPNAAMERIIKIDTDILILMQQKNEEQRKLNEEQAKIDALPSESDTINYNEYEQSTMDLFTGEVDWDDKLVFSGKIQKKTHVCHKTDDFPNTSFLPDNRKLSVTNVSQSVVSCWDFSGYYFNKETAQGELIYIDHNNDSLHINKVLLLSGRSPQTSTLIKTSVRTKTSVMHFSGGWFLLRWDSGKDLIEGSFE